MAQLLRGATLFGFAILLVALGIVFARPRCLRLIRRVRYLLLVLVALFAWFTPGELMLSSVPGSPTHEGVALAAMHGGRLLSVVVLAALLLQFLDTLALASGLSFLLGGGKALDGRRARLIVRILLVLRYAETPPTGGWRALLVESEEGVDGSDGTVLRVSRWPWRLRDWIVCGMMGGLLVVQLGAMW